MFEEDDLLDIFLTTATEENVGSVQNKPVFKETDIFKNEAIEDVRIELKKDDRRSLIHSGDTDSSDDEDNKNPEDRRYNAYGNEIKRLLSDVQPHTRPINGFSGPRERVSWKTPSPITSESSKLPLTSPKRSETKKDKDKFDVFTDPVFGLRIMNPLISSSVLQERMIGRDPVQFGQLNRYLQTHNSEKDWVLAGVVANKSAVRTSQNGKKFSIWTLTDLKDDIKTVSVFLFGNAHSQLWKTQIGTVIGILNPNVLDKKDSSKDIVSIHFLCFILERNFKNVGCSYYN